MPRPRGRAVSSHGATLCALPAAVPPLPPRRPAASRPSGPGAQVLPFEQQYLEALPSAHMYEKSYMHRDTLTHVAVRQRRVGMPVLHRRHSRCCTGGAAAAVAPRRRPHRQAGTRRQLGPPLRRWRLAPGPAPTGPPDARPPPPSPPSPPRLQATTSDFIITGSSDGHLKFWKKQEGGIEFVKHYRAHLGSVDGACMHAHVGRSRAPRGLHAAEQTAGQRAARCPIQAGGGSAKQATPRAAPAAAPHPTPGTPQASPSAPTARCARASAATAPSRCLTCSRLT